MKPGLKRWGKRAGITAIVYLLLWGVTAVFGPGSVELWFEKNFQEGQSFNGPKEPVQHYRNVKFKGEGRKFFPDPAPDAKWFCCVGTPVAICPFVVTTECVYIDGPLSGYGGKVTFLWTPFCTWAISGKKHWVS